jgi:hypothetical protein
MDLRLIYVEFEGGLSILVLRNKAPFFTKIGVQNRGLFFKSSQNSKPPPHIGVYMCVGNMSLIAAYRWVEWYYSLYIFVGTPYGPMQTK